MEETVSLQELLDNVLDNENLDFMMKMLIIREFEKLRLKKETEAIKY